MFYFHPYLGEDSHFDEHIFQMGWFNHQLDKQNPKGHKGIKETNHPPSLRLGNDQWIPGKIQFKADDKRNSIL